MSKSFIFTGSFLSGIVDPTILFLDSGNSSSYSGTGVDFFDLSPSGYDATLVNSPTYSPVDGGILIFNGIDQHLSGMTGLTLPTGNPFTIYTVSYLDSSSGLYPFMFALGGFTCFPSTAGGSYFGLNIGGGTAGLYTRARVNEAFPVDQYVITSISYNGTGSLDINNFSIEINGVSKSLVSAGADAQRNDNLIGSSSPTAPSSERWKGSIPVIAVYDYELSAIEHFQNVTVLKNKFGIV